jgi:hypothetical protein
MSCRTNQAHTPPSRARRWRRSAVRWLGVSVGLGAVAYGTYVAMAWHGYGRPRAPNPSDRDDLLDRFMPAYDVVERHHVQVAASAAVTLGAARDVNRFDVPVVRAVFKARELLLRATPGDRRRPTTLVAEMQSLGWTILAETPGREIVVGAVTKPWEANVTFRSVPAETFLAFNEPEYVKIVWTLRADPTGTGTSMFRTETRAVATDASARAKFRRYWSLLSPGIFVIRQMLLRPVKTEAERRARESAHVN